MATPSHLHEDLAELAFLLGDWSGAGEGVWPPGERFDYAEDVTFEFVGDPFLLYAQRSWSLDDGSPIHFERGFLRPAGPGIVELLLAHPIGITEVAVGTVDEGLIELSSTAVSLAPTASPVTSSIARAAAWACRLNAPADPTRATASSRMGQVRRPVPRRPDASSTPASTRFSRLNP